MKPSFTNKQQYLQWRTQWRARYREISTDIRLLRLYRSAYQSGIGNKRWDKVRPALLDLQKKYTDKTTGIFNFHGWLWKLRQEAAQMLLWRKESKLLAQQHYLAARQACSSPS